MIRENPEAEPARQDTEVMGGPEPDEAATDVMGGPGDSGTDTMRPDGET